MKLIEAWAEHPPLRWDFQLTIHIRTIFIGQITGFEVKRLSAYMQFAASCTSTLSCFDISKEPGLCVFASPPGFHSGGGQPSLEQEGMWDKIVALGIQNRSTSFDLEARQYVLNNWAPKVIHTAWVAQITFLGSHLGFQPGCFHGAYLADEVGCCNFALFSIIAYYYLHLSVASFFSCFY